MIRKVRIEIEVEIHEDDSATVKIGTTHQDELGTRAALLATTNMMCALGLTNEIGDFDDTMKGLVKDANDIKDKYLLKHQNKRSCRDRG